MIYKINKIKKTWHINELNLWVREFKTSNPLSELNINKFEWIDMNCTRTWLTWVKIRIELS